jgi:peptidoglycan/LPS O-acetylase OafA/YrhL
MNSSWARCWRAPCSTTRSPASRRPRRWPWRGRGSRASSSWPTWAARASSARGLPASLIVAGAVALEANGRWRTESRWLRLLGDASYSVYLGHLYAVIAFRVLWERAHLPAQGPLWAAVFIGLCIAAGTASGLALYRFVERPITRRLKDLRRPARGQLSPTLAG